MDSGIMNLPSELLGLIGQYVATAPANKDALEYFEIAKEEKQKWASLIMPDELKARPLEDWETENAKLRGIYEAAQRMTIEYIAAFRRVNRSWANIGAEILVKLSNASLDERPYCKLDFDLKKKCLEHFFAVASNPILSKAVRQLRIWKSTLVLVDLSEHEYETFRKDYEDIEIAVGNGYEKDFIFIATGEVEHNGDDYSEYCRINAQKAAMLKDLQSRYATELIPHVKNLTRVENILFQGHYTKGKTAAYYRQTVRAQNPGALQDQITFRTMLPQAFADAGVPIRNLYQHFGSLYFAYGSLFLEPLATVTHLTVNAVTDVARGMPEQYSTVDWTTVLSPDHALQVLELNDDLLNGENTTFSNLCHTLLRAVASSKIRLQVLYLRRVHLSLPLLSDVLVNQDPARLYMENVRAQHREDWRGFMDGLKPRYSADNIILECPHPAQEGGSNEWEYIQDIVTEYGRAEAFYTDIGRYLES